METGQIISQLNAFQARLYVKIGNVIEPAAPGVLATNLLLIRGLLVQLVDRLAEADRGFRLMRAARYDGFLKDGMKKSPALEQLEMEEDLIGMRVETDRIRNYMKYVDGVCTSVQSVLKLQTASDKNQY